MDETSEKMPTKISGKGATPWLEDAWQPLGRLRGDMERKVPVRDLPAYLREVL